MIPLGTLPIPTDSMSAFVMPTWPGSRLGIVRKQNGKHVVGFIGLILRFRILRLDIYSFGRHIGIVFSRELYAEGPDLVTLSLSISNERHLCQNTEGWPEYRIGVVSRFGEEESWAREMMGLFPSSHEHRSSSLMHSCVLRVH